MKNHPCELTCRKHTITAKFLINFDDYKLVADVNEIIKEIHDDAKISALLGNKHGVKPCKVRSREGR